MLVGCCAVSVVVWFMLLYCDLGLLFVADCCGVGLRRCFCDLVVCWAIDLICVHCVMVALLCFVLGYGLAKGFGSLLGLWVGRCLFAMMLVCFGLRLADGLLAAGLFVVCWVFFVWEFLLFSFWFVVYLDWWWVFVWCIWRFGGLVLAFIRLWLSCYGLWLLLIWLLCWVVDCLCVCWLVGAMLIVLVSAIWA